MVLLGETRHLLALDPLTRTEKVVHVWGQMEVIDWSRHLIISDPRVVMNSKKHKYNPRVIRWTEEAQLVVDRQPGIITPTPSLLL